MLSPQLRFIQWGLRRDRLDKGMAVLFVYRTVRQLGKTRSEGVSVANRVFQIVPCLLLLLATVVRYFL